MSTGATQADSSASPLDPPGFEESAWIERVIDGRYRIERLLGEGGMGAVFLAEHVKLQKKVALKVILPQFAGNGEVAERFAREAMASAKLEHPHVASALDYGTLAEGGAYLVMQYARGPSLRRALAERRGWRYACDVGAQIADALSAAHASGIVHRDLKPENVVLEARDDGTELVRVLDFGIARVLDPNEPGSSVSKLTRVGTIIGTPGYMAPEQALGEPVDTRADLYALGVILWEICAGRELFTETEVTALVTRQLTTEPPRLRSIDAEIPPELEDVVARLLARDRSHRPEKAGEVREVLRRLAFAANMERFSQASPPAQPQGFGSPSGGSTGGSASTGSHPTGLPSAPTMAGTIGLSIPAAVRLPSREARSIPVVLRSLDTRSVLAIAAVAAALFALVLGALLVALWPSPAPDAPTPPVALSPQPPALTARPSTPQQPVRVPTTTAPPPAAPPTPGSALAPIPEIVAADFETLLHAEARAERRSVAARLVVMPRGTIPEVVRLVAALEDETGCTDRRALVEELVELGDARALPALERLADSPRRGCGFLGSQDCIRCLRGPLRDALAALR